MIQIDVHHLVASLTFLAGSHKHLGIMRRKAIETGDMGIISPQELAQMREAGRRLGTISSALDMPASGASTARLIENIDRIAPFHFALTPDRLGLIVDEINTLASAFHDELASRLLVAFPTASKRYFTDAPLFGEAVQEAFPGVTYDLTEAGRCLALGRWTATVMHLMRTLEAGLEALSTHLDIPPGENWNQTLNAIEVKLRDVKKKTEGREGEQWAAEAGVHLRFIKNAWRNHAMHPLERYDQERATQIFENTRAFMQHLAAKLENREGI